MILAVPCCQHELLGQLDNEVLRPLLRHGTLRERFVAEVTDAARARLLELAGYDVQVVEFVALEHTPKNVLLRAVRTERPEQTARLAREYRAFADSLGIQPALERLLGDLVPAGRAQPARRQPAFCQRPIRLPSLSWKYAATPMSPTWIGSPIAEPPLDRTRSSVASMSSTAIVITGRLTISPRCVMPPPM